MAGCGGKKIKHVRVCLTEDGSTKVVPDYYAEALFRQKLAVPYAEREKVLQTLKGKQK